MNALTIASLLVVLLMAVACGGTDNSGAAIGSEPTSAPTTIVTPSPTSNDEPAPPLPTTSATTPAATSAVPSTAALPSTTAPPTTTTSSTTTSPTTTSTAPGSDCVLVEDFGEGAEQRWRVVNDGVMGGLSEGTLAFGEGTMVFAGEINTDGGGFSSVRFTLPGGWGSATELLLRARSDGRSYEIQVDDSLDGRNRRITHFGSIPMEGSGEWQDVRVDLTNLEARVFGRSVDAAAFQPDLATSVGVILADGSDGPFRFEIDSLEACR